jgi:hypothetical protein
MAIGVPGAAPQGQFDAGSVHVFRRSLGAWSLVQVLTASDVAAHAGFGEELALLNDQLFVGADRHSNGPSGAFRAGAVYVFELGTGQWSEVQQLFAPQGSVEAYFGSSLAAQDETLMVGEPHNGDLPSAPSGSTYVYEKHASGWDLVQVLKGSKGGPGDAFGGARAISIAAGTAMIGALIGQSPSLKAGTVYVFEKGATGWMEVDALTPLDPLSGSMFGRSVEVRGPHAIIGTRGDNDLGPGSGSAYHFRKDGSTWQQVGKLLAVDGQPYDDLCFYGVSLYGTVALLGAPAEDGSGFDDQDGAAYFFELATSATQYCSCASAAPCGNRDDHGGCLNTLESGGVLAAAASGSVIADDLRMEARWLSASQPALAFMGESAQSLPFGDGLMCVGPGSGGMYRLAPSMSGSDGVVAYGPGLVAYTHDQLPPSGQIEAGDTWCFQVWYRDQHSPCGSGFNLTNALRVEFTP